MSLRRSLGNQTKDWVRVLCIVLSAKPQQVSVGAENKAEQLGESWLQWSYASGIRYIQNRDLVFGCRILPWLSTLALFEPKGGYSSWHLIAKGK